MYIPGFNFTQYTLSEVQAKLSSRLNDPDNVYWSLAEINLYLQEALDTWNLYARYFSVHSTIQLASGSNEIDLTNLTSVDSTGASYSPNSYQVSGQKILTSSLIHTLELQSTDLSSYVPTGHISQNLLNYYISIAFNQFIQESYSYINKHEYPITAEILTSNNGKYYLPQYVNNLSYVEHISLATAEIPSTTKPLRRVAMQDARNVMRQFWNAQSRPQYYSVDQSGALQLYLLPWPNDIATLRIYSVDSTELASDLFSVDQLFSLPYELWCGVKFLTLYKIYSTDGPTAYPQMAEYALNRYKQYISLARNYTPINFGWVEEQPLYISPFTEFDNLYPGWRNKSARNLDTGASLNKELGILSPNLLISPSKYNCIVSYSFDVVRNAPTLSTLEYFPVGEEYLTYILDYAEHIAAIKMGGVDFARTGQLFESFLNGAMRYNDKLKAALTIISSESQGATRQRQSTQESDRRDSPVDQIRSSYSNNNQQ